MEFATELYRDSPSEETAFERETDRLTSRFTTLWMNTLHAFRPCGVTYTLQQQCETEARVRELGIGSEESGANSPKNALLQLQRLKTSAKNLVVQSFASDHTEEADALLVQFSNAADEFIRDVQQFDPELSPGDTFQALRNLWVINSLQAAFGLPVRLDNPGFAYSLLYPYTDNYLDDPSVPEAQKREFTHALSRRLAGLRLPVSSRLVTKVSDLLTIIETVYPRTKCPELYQSLSAIHRSQQASLLQNDSAGDDSGILHISVAKGGTSVLADAYIARGWVTPLQAEFAFGYGVLLQFIDDLQDVEKDLRTRHTTPFTLAARRGVLDAMANRLLGFVDIVLESTHFHPLPPSAFLPALTRKACCALILESIALNPGSFSSGYAEAVEPYSPLRFEYMRQLHREIHTKQGRLQKVFKRNQRMRVSGHVAITVAKA